MNRLLINMRNKINVIDGAINQCMRLINDETIKLNGLHKISVSKGNVTDKELRTRINQLIEEKNNLTIRVNRMS